LSIPDGKGEVYSLGEGFTKGRSILTCGKSLFTECDRSQAPPTPRWWNRASHTKMGYFGAIPLWLPLSSIFRFSGQ